MTEQFKRTEKLIGNNSLEILKNSHVAVFGLGGVGGYVCEALARAGVGKMTVVDNDCISLSNLNRQIIATHSTVGCQKTDLIEERILDINPACEIIKKNIFYLPETAEEFDFKEYDYVVDAVDTVAAKIDLVVKAQLTGTNIISSMGTGNKMKPELFEIEDIYRTSVCPLAKVMRKELKSRGVKKLKVIYSKEVPVTNERPPASISFVPPIAGLLIGGEVIKDLINWER